MANKINRNIHSYSGPICEVEDDPESMSRKTKANGIDIQYDTFGKKSNSTLLLSIGLAGQLTWWDDDLCGVLARAGHFVIRYDNRDSGLSSKMDQAGLPDLDQVPAPLPRGIVRRR